MPATEKHIVIITGSVRPQNFTMKAAKILGTELEKNSSFFLEIIDAATLRLPLPGMPYIDSSHEML